MMLPSYVGTITNTTIIRIPIKQPDFMDSIWGFFPCSDFVSVKKHLRSEKHVPLFFQRLILWPLSWCCTRPAFWCVFLSVSFFGCSAWHAWYIITLMLPMISFSKWPYMYIYMYIYIWYTLSWSTKKPTMACCVNPYPKKHMQKTNKMACCVCFLITDLQKGVFFSPHITR